MDFTPQVLDHFEHPRNAGELPAPAISVETSNPACGDVLKLWARVENGVIAEAKFKATGCTTAIACASILTEIVAGVPVMQAKNISAQMIADSLGGLPEATAHGSQLAEEALKALLEKARS